MKMRLIVPLRLLSSLLVCSLTSAAFGGEFAHPVEFELGDTEFAPGDSITISEVRGTAATITTGQTYAVSGSYTLGSHEQAELAFFVTVPNSGPAKVDPKQTMRITKGRGTFRLVKTMDAQGYPHISFYPLPAGNSFGGVYFGQDQTVLRNKGWSTHGHEQGAAGVNQAIFKYLGEPVAPPSDLDPAYSRPGLHRALAKAAQRAGLTINSVQIDDSEFPFLLGVVSSGDFDRFVDELKKMEGYDFTGSVGHKTYHAFNITPWRVFPPESAQRIGRRLGVRMQILADKISGH